MRCEQILRHLATPTDRIDSATVDAHLASCTACASWSEQADRLNRALELTRPGDPGAAAFDALWGRVLTAVDAPAPARLSVRSRTLRVGFLVARAAAVLLFFGLSARYYFGPGERPETDSPLPVESLALVPITENETCVIRINDGGVEVVQLDSSDSGPIMAFNAELPAGNDNDALNLLESMAE
ncbi:MAG: hypothetical protein SFX72_16740 [Isosphaeraceae bacterium]|nr:hypothetical protein [Isosphaeraceae bacterium]